MTLPTILPGVLAVVQYGGSTIVRCIITTLLLYVPGSILAGTALSQEPRPTATANGEFELSVQQSRLADKYERLEILLLKMAEFDASENPRRAALLRKALSQSKDRQLHAQMESLVKLLSQKKLKRAIDDQEAVGGELRLLLDLLQSENRPDQLKGEQSRVRGYIKELDRIIRQQKSVKGRTEGGDNQDRLATDQGKVSDRTSKLAKLIDDNEGTAGSDDPSETAEVPDDGTSSDGKSKSDGQPKGDSGKPSDRERADGLENKDTPENGKTPEEPDSDDGGQPHDDSQPGESQDQQSNQNGKPSEAQPSRGSDSSQDGPQQGQQQQGQQQQGQQQQGQQRQGQQQQGRPGGQSQQQQQQNQQQGDPFPGRKRIAAAQEKMKQARRRLEEAQRKEALQEQEEATRLLQQAKAELEEILRQLREEEIERMLALLEGRFRKMLEMQLKVYEDTQRLNRIAARQTKQVEVQSGRLSLEERSIIREADKALTLMREEASSVAFPEAVDQMREDMQQVADRLSAAKVGRITLSVEEDIITALEEMIEALQRAQKDAEQRRQQQQRQQGNPQDQPLVDKISELKMIRALQMRINKRTQRYAQLLDAEDDLIGQAVDPDLIESLQRLSLREQRIHEITRDIVLGKNR